MWPLLSGTGCTGELAEAVRRQACGRGAGAALGVAWGVHFSKEEEPLIPLQEPVDGCLRTCPLQSGSYLRGCGQPAAHTERLVTAAQ